MVGVGEKPITHRRASAEGFVRVSPALADAIHANALAKGDLLAVARLAGIQAAKRTSELIPLCHPIPIDHIAVQVELLAHASSPRVHITAEVESHARTGVEMEALTAVTAAALTIIDMGKAVDRAMVIEGVHVTAKSGGRSGDWVEP